MRLSIKLSLPFLKLGKGEKAYFEVPLKDNIYDISKARKYTVYVLQVNQDYYNMLSKKNY